MESSVLQLSTRFGEVSRLHEAITGLTVIFLPKLEVLMPLPIKSGSKEAVPRSSPKKGTVIRNWDASFSCKRREKMQDCRFAANNLVSLRETAVRRDSLSTTTTRQIANKV